ncbi:hypothetical protein B7486_55100, partial [cyanobacterium TDX16]
MLATTLAACGDEQDESSRPDLGGNVVVILTDDQTLASLEVMPRTRALIADEGTEFRTAIVTMPLCCPSRASFLTGQLAHNHGVLDNVGANGGISAFDAEQSLAVWLQDAGYTTSFLGKYLNGYGELTPATVPPGWDRWFGLVDPTTYSYEGFTAFDGDQAQSFGPGEHQTQVLADHAVAEIDALAPEDAPFFLHVTPLAPHHADPREAGLGVTDVADLGEAIDAILPTAPGYEEAVASLTAPAGPAQDEADLSDKPPYVQAEASVVRAAFAGVPGATPVQLRDRYYRAYASQLLALDEMVDQIVTALDESGELDETLIVFQSDNGLMLGEHGLFFRKIVPYDPS